MSKIKDKENISEKDEIHNNNMKEYSTKLQAVDKSITSQIGQQASALGYTMVISKGSVVYGGDDITDAVIKVIK